MAVWIAFATNLNIYRTYFFDSFLCWYLPVAYCVIALDRDLTTLTLSFRFITKSWNRKVSASIKSLTEQCVFKEDCSLILSTINLTSKTVCKGLKTNLEFLPCYIVGLLLIPSLKIKYGLPNYFTLWYMYCPWTIFIIFQGIITTLLSPSALHYKFHLVYSYILLLTKYLKRNYLILGDGQSSSICKI